jgi:peptidoglycan/LPS O-acetylase OafA/YrhL
MNKAKKFRPDINALRALAVVLVLLFHFFQPFSQADILASISSS